MLMMLAVAAKADTLTKLDKFMFKSFLVHSAHDQSHLSYYEGYTFSLIWPNGYNYNLKGKKIESHSDTYFIIKQLMPSGQL